MEDDRWEEVKCRLAGRRAHAIFSLVCALVLGSAPGAQAQSLAEQIDTLFGPQGIVLAVPTPGFAHTAHFTSSTLSTLGLIVGQLAPAAADFPAISTVPGFSYTYDPELDEFTRRSTSMGPIFVERARTIGKGIFDVGLAYSYIDFDELNGESLDNLSLVLLHSKSDIFGPGAPAPAPETTTVRFEKFNLRSHVVSLFTTYGITDRWDVNALLPLVHTSLDVRARATLDNVVTEFIDSNGDLVMGNPGFHFFTQPLGITPGITEQTFSASDDKTGVGDLLLRTKYHLFDGDWLHLSPGLILRVPTGDEKDFQGLGDTTLNLLGAASLEFSRFHFHANLGYDYNFDDVGRSRLRYAGGVTVQVLLERLALTADVIGSSNLKRETVSVSVPVFDNNSFITDPPTPSGFTTASDSIRTDIVDLSLGFKVALYKSVVGFANVLVPLNDDGLRAKAIPTAGIEVSF